ncbi:MAG: hypothetical protein ABJK39_07610 [Hyphomicrobiales bacterium]
MRNLISLTLLAGLMATSGAHAEFKVAEFTFGQPGSTKTTVFKSIKDYRAPKVANVNSGLTSFQIKQMYKNISVEK